MDCLGMSDEPTWKIFCEECIHDPIPNCNVCEELIWLHEFRNGGEEE